MEVCLQNLFTCAGDRSARVNEQLAPFVEWREICKILRILPGAFVLLLTHGDVY